MSTHTQSLATNRTAYRFEGELVKADKTDGTKACQLSLQNQLQESKRLQIILTIVRKFIVLRKGA